MSLVSAAIWILVAAGFALAIELLARFWGQQFKADRRRMESAKTAYSELDELLDELLKRESVSPLIKRSLIEIVEVVPDRLFSNYMLELLEHDGPLEVSESDRDLDEAFEKLQSDDRQAYQMVLAAFRTATVATILQWPESAKRLDKLMLRWASDAPEATMHSAVEVRRKIGHAHQFGTAQAFA